MSELLETLWTDAAGEAIIHGCTKPWPNDIKWVRADLPPTLSAAMELPEVRALVEAARKMLVAAELREIYHRLPNDKNRIGDPKSPKAKAKDAWLKAFRQASSATSLALAAIKEPKT